MLGGIERYSTGGRPSSSSRRHHRDRGLRVGAGRDHYRDVTPLGGRLLLIWWRGIWLLRHPQDGRADPILAVAQRYPPLALTIPSVGQELGLGQLPDRGGESTTLGSWLAPITIVGIVVVIGDARAAESQYVRPHRGVEGQGDRGHRSRHADPRVGDRPGHLLGQGLAQRRGGVAGDILRRAGLHQFGGGAQIPFSSSSSILLLGTGRVRRCSRVAGRRHVLPPPVVVVVSIVAVDHGILLPATFSRRKIADPLPLELRPQAVLPGAPRRLLGDAAEDGPGRGAVGRDAGDGTAGEVGPDGLEVAEVGGVGFLHLRQG